MPGLVLGGCFKHTLTRYLEGAFRVGAEAGWEGSGQEALRMMKEDLQLEGLELSPWRAGRTESHWEWGSSAGSTRRPPFLPVCLRVPSSELKEIWQSPLNVSWLFQLILLMKNTAAVNWGSWQESHVGELGAEGSRQVQFFKSCIHRAAAVLSLERGALTLGWEKASQEVFSCHGGDSKRSTGRSKWITQRGESGSLTGDWGSSTHWRGPWEKPRWSDGAGVGGEAGSWWWGALAGPEGELCVRSVLMKNLSWGDGVELG